MNYKEECLKIYYTSDVVNKELSFGCEVIVSYWDKPVFISTGEHNLVK